MKYLISLSTLVLIHRPEIDHVTTDFVVAVVNINKGTGGSDLEA